MLDGAQLTLADESEEYRAFVEKFKPKKTTDDCYTPPEIYDVILRWAASRYGFDMSCVVRPFWPDADFMRYDYPDGCVVVDNPPFSILSKICNAYRTRGIRFFLFAPTMTILNTTGRDSVMELDEPVGELLFLELPSKDLCSEDCRGFCPKCGKDLNTGDCDCNGKEIDPRLAVLQKFLTTENE